jgi:competence protein ComEA
VPAASTGLAGAGTTVDINTADATALETLDGIGPALAQRILDYRTAHGGFRTAGDLQNVPGIGPKKFAAIKAKVRT